jgi:hypothetical protein
MKRITMLLASLLLCVAVTSSMAHDEHAGGAKMDMGGVKKTVTGEVVDMGCYLGHGAKGEGHIACATKCINNGMPMGLLTSDGKLFLLTMNHDNPDPYNKIKEMAGKTVAVTGASMARSGVIAIDVSDFKPVAAKAKA